MPDGTNPYPNQMRFIISRALRIHLKAISIELLIKVETTSGLKISHIKWKPHPQQDNELI